jgi:thioredoxin 1
MKPEKALPEASVLVVCLCADWCGVCRDYALTFRQTQSQFPQARFLWVDVEDEADLLYPLDVENFPTLLVIVGDQPRFFGPLRPQPETLERLIRAQIEHADARALTDRSVVELTARIQAGKPAA